ncbi:MAG: GAP family protein [Nanoarchaeota archaeon]|mgnify:CR=1 FL=1
MVNLPSIPLVLGTAAVDSINPCAIGVLILLISTLLHLSKDKKKMLAVGVIYISTVFVTYLAAGLGLLTIIQKLQVAKPLGIFVGGLVIILGLIEIKDFFWYGKGISLAIPPERAKQIEQYIKHVTVPGAIFLGAFVAAVELPCTGGPYLAITTVLAKIGFSLNVFLLLVLYNFIFVLPLIVILGLAFFGVSTEALQKWKTQNRTWMRLAIGLVMLALGVLLILFAMDIIKLAITI